MRTRLLFLFALLSSLLSAQQLRYEVLHYRAEVNQDNYREKLSYTLDLDGKSVQQGRFNVYRATTSGQSLVFTGFFLDGKLVDTATWYGPNGAPVRQALFARENAEFRSLPWRGWYGISLGGTLDGEMRTWYESKTYGKRPQQELVVHYKKHVLHGLSTTWYENGAKKKEGNYEEGKRSGKWKRYREDGSLEDICTYRDNQLQDTTWIYYPSGKLQSIQLFKTGTQHGDRKEYDSTGTLSVYKHYFNGWQDSVEIGYYPSGEMHSRCQYRNDKPNGDYTSWHKNGKIAVEGRYRRGDRVGTWKQYDDKGRLRSIHDYDQDPEPVMITQEGPESLAIEEAFTSVWEMPSFRQPADFALVTRADHLKFLKHYEFIDVQANFDALGNVTWSLVTPMPVKDGYAFLAYLKTKRTSNRTMRINGRPTACTMTLRIHITK